MTILMSTPARSFTAPWAAETYARSFDKARAFNGFKPLYIAQTGEQEWTVFNPGYAVERTPIPRREPIARGNG